MLLQDALRPETENHRIWDEDKGREWANIPSVPPDVAVTTHEDDVEVEEGATN